MPYYAKKRMPRKNYRRKRKSLAAKAYNLAKKAYKTQELKYNETSVTTAQVYENGYTYSLSQLSLGTGHDQRIGQVVTPTSLIVKPNWASITTPTVSWRLIIFKWNSESPVIGASSTSSILETATLNSFKSVQNRFASQILYDKTFYNDNNASTAYHPSQIKIKLNKMINYDTGGTANPNRNGIYFMILNDFAASAAFNFESRLYYKDA